MPLAMLNAGALDTPTAMQRAPSIFAAPIPATAAPSSSRAPAAAASRSAAATTPSRRPYAASNAPPSSVALVLQFLPLRSFIAAARTCKSWSAAARSRMAWSDGRQWLTVTGSREELRQQGAAAGEESRLRNFNPHTAHRTPTDEIVRGTSSAASSSSSSSSAATASAPAVTPLLRACSTPLLLNVRHLRYRFASPSIRTAIASLESEDMYETSAVCSRFPLCGLPRGALPFLASLALDDVTTCSQPTLQSAFASLGVQAHSHLRALRLQSNPVLSAVETFRTLRAVLDELPANLRNLEVLHLPQRNLPLEVPLEPLLSLAHLHTLLLDASCAKSPARLQVLRSLSLHAQLRHIKWPLWRAEHMRQLFGGVRLSLDEEDALSAGLALARTGSDDPGGNNAADLPAAPAEVAEEAVLGLDDDENDLAAALSPLEMGGHQSGGATSFGFESWLVDGGVSAANMSLYFGAQPSLLPKLHTLSFVSPHNFASFVPLLPAVLASLPALTALRVQVPYFSLGTGFFRELAGIHLPQLRRLQLDQVSLVQTNQSGGSSEAHSHASGEALSSPIPCLWRAFPGLEELALLNMTLPSWELLAESMPLLRRVELHNVSASGGGIRAAPAMQQWLMELAQLPRLSHLVLLHCADVDVDSLFALAHCRSLESLHFCSQGERHAHAHAAHSRTGESSWEHSSLRHFDALAAEEEPDAGAAPSSRGAGMQRQNSGSSRVLSWTHTQLLALQRRQMQLARQQRLQRPRPASSSALAPAPAPCGRMLIHFFDDVGQRRILPALAVTDA